MKALIALVALIAALALAGSALGDSFITDTLAPGGGSSSQPQSYRFITDTLAPGGGSATIGAPESGTFSWSDAGVGAGAAAGAMLALIGSALVVIRRPGRMAL